MDSREGKKTLFRIKKGSPLITGTEKMQNGYQFSIHAPKGAEVFLLLYEKDSAEPVQEIALTDEYRIGDIRTVWLPDFKAKQYTYNYLIDGKVVQDPYARRILGQPAFGEKCTDQDPHRIRCGFLQDDFKNWEEDKLPRIPYDRMILYKLHVRGYTKQHRMAPGKRGTFAGLKEMIPYWKELGINAIELMPAYEFLEYPQKKVFRGIISPKAPEHVNYWGYGTAFYFAPKAAYCATRHPEKEFKQLVYALHEAGMECIMEFFFSPGVNPLMVLRCLHFWHLNYHIDGFHLVGEGVPKELLLRDGALSGAKLMADSFPQITEDAVEMWEADPQERKMLAEYNLSFQNDMRRFLKSDDDTLNGAMYHIRNNPARTAVINYMASNDGFTLHDMVSYSYKHNEENEEENRDGSQHNYSWNCGEEGPTKKKSIRQMRFCQMKNAFLMLLLSQGTPMIYGGDEIANTQNGNNNAWCQDNPTGWVDWKGLRYQKPILQFVKETIAFRKNHPVFHMETPPKGVDYKAYGFPDISFHGERAWYTGSDYGSRLLGVMYNGAYEKTDSGERDEDLYVAYNFHWETREIALPSLPVRKVWHKLLDTSEEKTENYYQEDQTDYRKKILLQPRSVVILVGRPGTEPAAEKPGRKNHQKEEKS